MFLRSVFCIQQLCYLWRVVFHIFLAILISDPNWPFCKGSPCIGSVFSHFHYCLISRILNVFSSRFLHTTTVLSLKSRFSHIFGDFNFWPKLTILQRLQPFHSGHFCQFLLSSHFSNIKCFFEPVFYIQQLCYVWRVVFHIFLALLIFDPN